MDRIGRSDKFTDPGRFGFIEIEFGDVRGVEIHGAYRSLSSSIIFVLSLTCGMRAQISRMESKICAFLPAGMCEGAVIGRSSATGSPRRSIKITPPSAASGPHSEGLRWRSRTEVFLVSDSIARAKTAASQQDSNLQPSVNGYGRPVIR